MTRIASATRTYRPACQRLSSSLRTRLKRRIRAAASLPCSGFRLRAVTSLSSSSGRDIRRSISWAWSVSEPPPPVTTIRKTMKIAPKTPPAMTISIGLLGGVAEHLRVQPEAGCLDSLRVYRTDTGGAILTDDLARVVDAAAHVLKQVLHHHHVAFHPGDLGNPHAFARPVGETADVHDDVERGGDLLAHRALRN